MTPEEQQELNPCVHRIAQLLYREAQAQGLPMSRLAAIEATVRAQVASAGVAPNRDFFSDQTSPPLQGRSRVVSLWIEENEDGLKP